VTTEELQCMILLGEGVLLKWCCSQLWRLFRFVASCMGWVSFLVLRPFRIIWCVLSSIFKNILPLCLEDGLSLSRNGMCGGSGGFLSSPTFSGSFDISCEDRCASISSPIRELLSPAYMRGSFGGRLFCLARVWEKSSTIPSDGLVYIPVMWKGWARLSDDIFHDTAW